MSIFEPDIGEKVTRLIETEFSGMVTGMHLVVEYIDQDGEQRNCVSTAPGQKMTTTNGLLTLANAVADLDMMRAVEDSMDDDD